MTAIEILERAISKLETLRDESPGEFDTAGFSFVFGVDGTTPEAGLLITLSRTVDPLLGVLRLAVEFSRITPNRYVDAALALARAILGKESDHDR